MIKSTHNYFYIYRLIQQEFECQKAKKEYDDKHSSFGSKLKARIGLGGGASKEENDIEERKLAFNEIDASAGKFMAEERRKLDVALNTLFTENANVEEDKENGEKLLRSGIPDYLAKISISSITFTIYQSFDQKVMQLITQKQKVLF